MTSVEDQTRIAVDFFSNLGRGGIGEENYAADLTGWSPLSGLMSRDEYLPKLEMVRAIFVEPLTLTIDATTSQLGRVAVQARSHGVLLTGKKYTNDYHFLAEFNDQGQIRHIREYFDMQRVRDLLVPAIAEWKARQQPKDQ